MNGLRVDASDLGRCELFLFFERLHNHVRACMPHDLMMFTTINGSYLRYHYYKHIPSRIISIGKSIHQIL